MPPEDSDGEPAGKGRHSVAPPDLGVEIETGDGFGWLLFEKKAKPASDQPPVVQEADRRRSPFMLTVRRRRTLEEEWGPPRRLRRVRFDTSTGMLQMLHAYGGCLLVPLQQEARGECLDALARVAVMAGVPHNLRQDGGIDAVLLPRGRIERMVARGRQAQMLQCKLPSLADVGSAESFDDRMLLAERRVWLLEQIDELRCSTALETDCERERRVDLLKRVRTDQQHREQRVLRKGLERSRAGERRAEDARNLRQQHAEEMAEKWERSALEAAARQDAKAEQKRSRADFLCSRRAELLLRHQAKNEIRNSARRAAGMETRRRLEWARQTADRIWEDQRSVFFDREQRQAERLAEFEATRRLSSARPSPKDRHAAAADRQEKLLVKWQQKEEKVNHTRLAHQQLLDDRARQASEHNREREGRVHAAQGSLLERKVERWEGIERKRSEKYSSLEAMRAERDSAAAAARRAHDVVLAAKRNAARELRDGVDGRTRQALLRRAMVSSGRAEVLQRQSPLALTQSSFSFTSGLLTSSDARPRSS